MVIYEWFRLLRFRDFCSILDTLSDILEPLSISSRQCPMMIYEALIARAKRRKKEVHRMSKSRQRRWGERRSVAGVITHNICHNVCKICTYALKSNNYNCALNKINQHLLHTLNSTRRIRGVFVTTQNMHMHYAYVI